MYRCTECKEEFKEKLTETNSTNDNVVKLLKYITDKTWNAEIQQHFHGLSHSHICLHIQFSSIRKNIV